MAPIWKCGKKGDKKKLLKTNTRLDQFIYYDDKKAAINFWFAQHIINLNDERMWNALKVKLKETKKKDLEVEKLKRLWMTKVDTELNSLCNVTLDERKSLGWRDDLTEDQKLQICSMRLESARNQRVERFSSIFLTENVEAEPVAKKKKDDYSDIPLPPIRRKSASSSIRVNGPTIPVASVPASPAARVPATPTASIRVAPAAPDNATPVAPGPPTQAAPDLTALPAPAAAAVSVTIASASVSGKPAMPVFACLAMSVPAAAAMSVPEAAAISVPVAAAIPVSAAAAVTVPSVLDIFAPTVPADSNCDLPVTLSFNEVDASSFPHVPTDEDIKFQINAPTKFCSAEPGASSTNMEGYLFPSQQLRGLSFHVLKVPGNYLDVAFAIGHEYFIRVHGGVVVSSLEKVDVDTLILASKFDSYNKRMFQKLEQNIIFPEAIYELLTSAEIKPIDRLTSEHFKHDHIYWPNCDDDSYPDDINDHVSDIQEDDPAENLYEVNLDKKAVKENMEEEVTVTCIESETIQQQPSQPLGEPSCMGRVDGNNLMIDEKTLVQEKEQPSFTIQMDCNVTAGATIDRNVPCADLIEENENEEEEDINIADQSTLMVVSADSTCVSESQQTTGAEGGELLYTAFLDESSSDMSEDVIQELLREQYKKRKEKEEKPQKKRDKRVADFIKKGKKQIRIKKQRAMWNDEARRNWIRAHAFKYSNAQSLRSQTQSKVSIRTLSGLVFNELVMLEKFQHFEMLKEISVNTTILRMRERLQEHYATLCLEYSLTPEMFKDLSLLLGHTKDVSK